MRVLHLLLLPALALCQQVIFPSTATPESPLFIHDADNTTRSGIFVRLTEKGANQLAHAAADILPQLLNNVTFAPIATAQATITPKITLFTKPIIDVYFLAGKGIRASLAVERVESDCTFEILFGEEHVLFKIENLYVEMEIHFFRNTTTHTNDIHADKCEVIEPDVHMTFEENSWLSEYNASIKTQIINQLRDAVCVTAIEALRYVDQQSVQKDPLAPLADSYYDNTTTTVSSSEEVTTTAAPSGEGFSAGEFAHDLCEKDEDFVTEAPKGASLTSPIQSGPPWSLDLNMRQLPNFTDNDVTFGVDGGVLLARERAVEVESPRPINAELLGDKMIGIMVTDYVPNTFFSHVYDYGFGQLDYRVHPDALPGTFRSAAKLFCGKCYLHISANLTEKPVVEISATKGVRAVLAANVSVTFNGKKSVKELLNATTKLHLTVHPVIRNSRIHGDVALTGVDFDVKELGVSGAMSGALERVVSFIVPRTIWPAMRKRIRFAINQRGVRLPILCGVTLKELDVSYTKRAAIVKSNFDFDTELFVRKFKAYTNAKLIKAGSKPLYTS